MSTIQKANALPQKLETDTTSTVHMFLTKTFACEILQRLEASRLQAASGQITNANDALDNLREKYGL